jgi:hypothetical protein
MAQVHRDRHHARMRRQYTGEQRSKLVDLVTGGHATLRDVAARLGVAPATGFDGSLLLGEWVIYCAATDARSGRFEERRVIPGSG